jgi:hypothetical protein
MAENNEKKSPIMVIFGTNDSHKWGIGKEEKNILYYFAP